MYTPSPPRRLRPKLRCPLCTDDYLREPSLASGSRLELVLSNKCPMSGAPAQRKPFINVARRGESDTASGGTGALATLSAILVLPLLASA